jgi:hypothetical protein
VKKRCELQLEGGYARVAAGVGMQGLLAAGEGVEQREARIARHQLVIPLQQELDRDGDPGRRLGQGSRARRTLPDSQHDRTAPNIVTSVVARERIR